MNAWDYVLAGVTWFLLLVARVVMIALGLVVVAVAVPFAVPGVSVSDGRPIVNLPRWAWPWGNDYDGLDGDKRGWWAQNTPLGVDVQSWFARWWWAAWRNPANNLRLLPFFSCPVAYCSIRYVGDYSVEDKAGQGGFQFVRAAYGWRRWYGLYWVKETSPTTARVLRLGFKIKPEHRGTPEPAKGLTFKFNLSKEI